MAAPAPSRRERLRSAAVAEIKSLARRLLVSGGIQAISLRAIAREMGMTAPAIYRYFPSLDALVGEITEDLYDELRGEVEAARYSIPQAVAVDRLLEMARAFRRWSVAHPAEFGLMFGNPVPGVSQFEDGCAEPDHAGARFGEPWLAVFAEAWRTHSLPTPPAAFIEEKLGGHISPHRIRHPDDVPIEVIYCYLSAWTRLYGLVALEVFGHLQWAVDSAEALFEIELAAYAEQLRRG